MKTRTIVLKLTKEPDLARAIDVSAAEARVSSPEWIKAQLRSAVGHVSTDNVVAMCTAEAGATQRSQGGGK